MNAPENQLRRIANWIQQKIDEGESDPLWISSMARRKLTAVNERIVRDQRHAKPERN